MGRAPCCDKENVKKGPWSPEEDAKLKEYIEEHGTGGNWIALPLKVGLKRCGKSCRLRWLNYLRPNIKHGEFSDSEDRIICSLFATIGSRWSIIAGQLPGRTDNDIKNYWNTKLKKKLQGLSSSSLNHNKRRLNQIQATTFSTLPNYKASVLQNSSMESSAFECGINAYYTNPFKGIPRAASYEPTFSFSTPVFMGSSCSTSSDGSCITTQISQESDQYGFSSTGENLSFQSCFGNGVLSDNNKFLIGSTDIAVDEKATTNGCFSSENSVMDYSIEEIKQLISTNSMYNNLNFFVDEIKTEE